MGKLLEGTKVTCALRVFFGATTETVGNEGHGICKETAKLLDEIMPLNSIEVKKDRRWSRRNRGEAPICQ